MENKINDTERIFTNEDIHFDIKDRYSSTTLEGKIDKENAIKEKAEAEKQGKKIVLICCLDTANWLMECLDVGLKLSELEKFVNAFNEHKYDDLLNWSKKEGEGFNKRTIFYSDEWISKVIGISQLIQRNEIQDLFISQMVNAVKTTNALFTDYELEIEMIIKLLQDTYAGISSKPLSLNRIQWRGTQKQLAELFRELKRNGWVEGYEYGAIKACFTKSDTIHQVLKPVQDKKTKEETYEGIYTERYKPMFYGIKENPKTTS